MKLNFNPYMKIIAALGVCILGASLFFAYEDQGNDLTIDSSPLPEARATLPTPRADSPIDKWPLSAPEENTAAQKSEEKREPENIPTENNEPVTVIAGESEFKMLVAPNTLFYDALVAARQKGSISFEGKNYPGLGFFMTDIGTLHAGDGKDLLYYINGKGAAVGVSAYTLRDGDVIEWKLE